MKTTPAKGATWRRRTRTGLVAGLLMLFVALSVTVGPRASAAPAAPSVAAAVPADFVNPIIRIVGPIVGKWAKDKLECLDPPDPAKPSAGLAGWLDPGPKTIPKDDPATPTIREDNPFAVDDPKTPNIREDATASIYEVYGYAGLNAHRFDRGDITGCLPGFSPAFTAINIQVWISTVTQAFTARLYSVVFSGLSFLQAFQEFSARMTGTVLLLPLLGLGLAVTGLYWLWRSKRGEVTDATTASMGTAAIALLGVVAAIYPLTIGAAVDTGMAKALSSVNSQVSESSGADASAVIATNMHEATLWQAWKQSTFGRDNAAAADKYGPALFRASAYTRAELADITAHPEKAGKLKEAKQKAYVITAEKIDREFPDAYSYVAGKHGDDAIGYWLVAMIATIAGIGFFIYALLKFLYAMVVTRVGIAIAPAVALATQFPRFQHKAFELVGYIVKGIISAVAFGAYAVIFVTGGLAAILSPETKINPLLKVLILFIMNLAAWVLAHKLGLLGSPKELRAQLRDKHEQLKGMRERRRHEAPADDSAAAASTTDELFDPGPAPAEIRPPAEASMKTAVLDGAKQGAAATAAAGALTGGTVTATGVAAGAAKGAAAVVVAKVGGGKAGTRRSRSQLDADRAKYGLDDPAARTNARKPQAPTRRAPEHANRVVEPAELYDPGQRTPLHARDLSTRTAALPPIDTTDLYYPPQQKVAS